ncbi:hypothetical protein ACS0TY_003379 [Phlomoides rotata]
MDDTGRKRSIIIPIIYALFFLCITTGGVLLIIYAFFPNLTQPWHPAAAFALIGTTWIFWLLTYIYSCIKLCLRHDVPQNTTRQITRKPSAAATQEGGTSHPQVAKQDSSVGTTSANAA